MKRKVLPLVLVFALCLGALPMAVSAADVNNTSIPYVEGSTRDYVQDDPADAEFVLKLSQAPEAGAAYKVYTGEDRMEEAGKAVLTGAQEVTVTLSTAPTRDMLYFLSATAAGKRESALAAFMVNAYHLASALSFSYGSNTDIPYYEFYQDEERYQIVLPTGTESGAAISLAVTAENGASVEYSGDSALANGEGTAAAIVTAADGSLSYTYTVHFTTMALEGAGTESEPYLISTAEELARLARCLNSGGAAPMDADGSGYGNYCGYYFKLTDDLDLSGLAWEPIGHSGNSYFAGHFDGGGHTVSNMSCAGKLNREIDDDGDYTVDCNALSAGGLFGWVAFGSVSNLIVRNASVSATGHNAMSYAGGLLAVAFGCTVTNCAVYDSAVESRRTPNNSNFAGGLVGIAAPLEQPASFEQCASDGNTVDTMSYGGGFIGSIDGYDDVLFTDCYAADCTITGSSTLGAIATQTGAFLGASQGGGAVLENCHLYGCEIRTGADSQSHNIMGLFAAGSGYGEVRATNCYYYDEQGLAVNADDVEAKTTAEFADGTVTGLLGSAFANGSAYPILNVAVAAVKLNTNSLDLYVGDTGRLTAVLTPGNAVDRNLSWHSGDEAVATVDGGMVSAVGAGTTDITVTTADGSYTDVCRVKVITRTIPAAGVTLTPSELSLTVGDTGRLTATVLPADATDRSVSWHSGDETVAAVRDGVVTAVGAGTARITAKTADGGYTAACEVKVTARHTGGGGSALPVYPPVIEKTDGGTVAASPENPWRGDTVTITVVPDEGYEVKAVTVTDRNGNPVKVTDNGDGTYTFVQPGGKASVEAVFARASVPRPAELPFADVPEGAWYEEAVRFVCERGLMTGTGADTFSPDAEMTRGMLVTILWRLEEAPDGASGGSFADLDETAYYSGAVHWAARNDIAVGYSDGRFGPDDLTTREQFAAILCRYARYKGFDTARTADLSAYADADQISAWALDALRWVSAEEIVQGTSGVTLSPGSHTTRAEAALILARFITNVAER